MSRLPSLLDAPNDRLSQSPERTHPESRIPQAPPGGDMPLSLPNEKHQGHHSTNRELGKHWQLMVWKVIWSSVPSQGSYMFSMSRGLARWFWNVVSMRVRVASRHIVAVAKTTSSAVMASATLANRVSHACSLRAFFLMRLPVLALPMTIRPSTRAQRSISILSWSFWCTSNHNIPTRLTIPTAFTKAPRLLRCDHNTRAGVAKRRIHRIRDFNRQIEDLATQINA